MATFTVGDVKLTRVAYFDIALGPEVVGLTADQVRSVPWSTPVWATPEGQVNIGQVVWVIEAGGHRIVVDPCGAADAFIRTGAEAVTHQQAVVVALEAAGFAPETVDTVVLSHLDGIGMTAAMDERGGWHPLFPHARVLLTDTELAWIDANPSTGGADALQQLREQGLVDGVGAITELAPGVSFELCGGHSAGHALVRIPGVATFVGHLALSPLHAATGVTAGHHDPLVAQATFDRLLAEAAHDGTLLIGPLWPAPGAGRVTGPPWEIEPAG